MSTMQSGTVADLRALRGMCLDRIAQEQRRVEMLDEVLRVFGPFDGPVEPQQLTLDALQPHQLEDPSEDQPVGKSRPIVDLTGADNLLERLIILAQAWGGVLECMEAAQYLIDCGYSTSTPKNLRPHVYNTLKDFPDFVKVGKGTFQYMPDSDDSMTEGGCESGTTTI